jgi:hypothetical protein
MMITDVHYAGDDERGRRVYLSFCDRFEQIARIQPPAAPFILFIGGDSSSHSVELLFSIAERVLAEGAVYVLCWGPGSARFEDVVDEEFVTRFLDGDLPPTVMTTSHEHESLEEALAFAITDAQPVAEYANQCPTVIVFAENVNWYNEAQNCLEDLLKSGTP